MRETRGFTLVEIMVALVVVGLFLTGVYTLMIRQQKTYEVQDRVVKMQQDLRAAMNLMRYDLRMIGHGVPSGTPGLVAVLNNQASAGETDSIAFNANLRASTVVLPAGDAGRYVLNAGVPAVIEVASVDGFNPPTPGYTVDLLDLATGDLVGSAMLSAVISLPPRLSVVPFRSATIQAGSYIGPTYQTVTYRVDTSGTVPVLQRGDGAGFETLMDDVDDFQIAYGFDGINGFPKDGVLRENGVVSGDDEWVFNMSGEGLPVIADGLRMVRVTILLRSRGTEKEAISLRPEIEDHPGGTEPDGHRRRMIRFSQEIRNL